ncbi:MAG: hypothetical protein ACFFD6_10665 [Candidatus Thorarchaeota archaeon]
MAKTNSLKVRFGAKINRLHFMLPIFFTIIISIILASFVLFVQLNGIHSTLIFNGIDEFFAAINIFFIVLISSMSLLIFFRLLKNRRELAIKILVSTFILSGILSTLLFTKLFFVSLGLEYPLLLIVVALITYIGAYFAYLVLVEALSDIRKNILFVVCSGALGAFIGVLVPTPAIIGISLFLSLADLILIKKKTVEKMVGDATYEKLISGVTFSSRQWGIGIGDLTCYSIVVSNTSVTFGVLAGVLSLLLISIGCFLSLVLTVKMIRIPGLPISTVLGLLPSIIMLFAF